MQRAVAGIGVTVVFKLLVSLCLALYCGMVIWGDGPARTARASTAPADTPAASAKLESGIRILPAPKQAVRIGPQMTRVAARPDVPKPKAVTPEEELAALVMATLARPTETGRAAPPANHTRRWITAGTANVRAEPNKRSALAGKIGRGGEVWVMWAEPNGWVRLRAADGTVTGFVHKSLLTDKAPKVIVFAAAD